jgi:hypothetical protein
MNIYSDGAIYGVCWDIYDSSYNLIKNYENIFHENITFQDLKEISKEYFELNDSERNKATFRFYVSYVSSNEINKRKNMKWITVNKDNIERLLLVKHSFDKS